MNNGHTYSVIRNGFNHPVVVSGIAQRNAIHYFLLFLFFMNRESKKLISFAALKFSLPLPVVHNLR